MSITVTINGVSNTIPEEGDTGWAGYTTNTLTALANGSLYTSDIVNDDTTGGAAVPASAEIVKTHGGEIDTNTTNIATNTAAIATKIGSVIEDTTPQLGGELDCQGNNISDVGILEVDSIRDSTYSKSILSFIGDANGANVVVVSNSATGSPVSVSASGIDAAIDFNITPKGSGDVNITTGDMTVVNGNIECANGGLLMGGWLGDASGNTRIRFTDDATPVNYLHVYTGDAGVDVKVETGGSDSNIDMQINCKGTGKVVFGAFPQTPSAAPTADYLVANKKYVDDSIISKPEKLFDFPAGSFDYPASNFAPLGKDTGSNNTVMYHAFDSSTDEALEGQIQLPSDLNTSGTVTFESIGYNPNASTGTVELAVSQVPNGTGETWDVAYSTTENGTATAHNTQDQDVLMSWTETVSNLGWAASDKVKFKLFRDTSEDTLANDYHLEHFRIRVPRT